MSSSRFSTALPRSVASLMLFKELRIRRGVRKSGDRFRPVSDAKTVRVRGGEVLLADGPFAQTKEQIAGYELIECANLDEAIAFASKHPMAKLGTVEVRQIWRS